MPSTDTTKYRAFLTRRFNETFVLKKLFEELRIKFQNYLSNTATAADVIALIDNIGANTSHLYLGVGKPLPWDNENDPPTPNTNVQMVDFDAWRTLIGVKKIEKANTAFVIPRRDWTSNTVYSQYDDTTDDLTSANIYVLDTQTLPNRVYKCLWNNNGKESTEAPSSTGNTVTPVATSDGYVWQYMYTISTDEYQFLTTSWMPVHSDPLVVASSESRPGILPIAVPLIVTDGGVGLNPDEQLVVTLTGDGNGATIYANTTSLSFTSNVITSIVLANGGVGYTQTETVTIGQESATSNASARIIIPPYPNHGYDPQTELGGAAFMLTVSLEDDELDKLTTLNDYRRIVLISDPLLANGSTANASVYRQTHDLYLASNTGVFQPDDKIQVSVNADPDNGTFPVEGTVVDVLTTGLQAGHTALVRVTGVLDYGRGGEAFKHGDEITDRSREGVSGVIAEISSPELQIFSGDVLYIDHRSSVIRQPNQSEEIKLVFRFD